MIEEEDEPFTVPSLDYRTRVLAIAAAEKAMAEHYDWVKDLELRKLQALEYYRNRTFLRKVYDAVRKWFWTVFA